MSLKDQVERTVGASAQSLDRLSVVIPDLVVKPERRQVPRARFDSSSSQTTWWTTPPPFSFTARAKNAVE